MASVQHNIYKLYAIKITNWFMLVMPVLALFYNHCGLNDQDLFILQSVYSMCIVIFEIPSGYFADLLGRKQSLVIGTICCTAGCVCYAMTSGFWGFLVAEIILGLGESFVSGADSAMLYDSLAEMKTTDRYLKLEGRVTALGNFAESIASIAGGTLAVIFGLRCPFIVQSFIAALAIPAAVTLVEPQRYTTRVRASLNHIMKVFYDSIFVNKPLSSALLVSSIAGTATLTMAWVAQLLFLHQDIGETWTTVLWVALNVCVACVSLSAGVVSQKTRPTTLLWGILCSVSLIYLSIPFCSFPVVLVLLFVFYATRGIATPVFKNQVNVRCQSEVRATVLSIRSLVIRLLFSAIGPAIGWIAVRHNFTNAVLSLGIFFTTSLLVTGIFFWHQNKKQSSIL